MQIIQHQELASTQSSIVFSSIPQTFTDLLLITSLRDNAGSTGWENAYIYPNGLSTNMTSRFLFGWGAGNVGSGVNSPAVIYHQTARNGNTANTFSNSAVYFSNYTSSSAKAVSADTTVIQNTNSSIGAITAALWNSSSAITSLEIVGAGTSFVQYSSATLYGILKGSDGIVTVS
jgi:hypothetical protein